MKIYKKDHNKKILKNSRCKKSQAALEFLTTYGWAFLVILIMIAALSYFGILSPSKLLPNRCNFGSEMGCTDFAIYQNGLQVRLKNNIGDAIAVDSILASTEKTSLSCTSLLLTMWKSGETKDVPLVCDFTNSGLTQGDKGKINLKISYHLITSSSAFAKDVNGEVYTVVKSDLVPSTGLVGFWRFDEGFGATTADSSGKGNNANLLNNPSWVAGKKGNALSFNGVDNYARTPAINLGSSFTVEFWIKPTQLKDYGDPLSAGTTDGLLTFVTYADGRIAFGLGNGVWGNLINTPAGTLVNNNWHHIVGTANNGQIELFINGASKGTALNSNSINQVINIGARTATNYYFNGLIDEVKIFNRALTSSEVLAEYSS